MAGRNNSAATVGFESELWQMADALREQPAEARRLDKLVWASLEDLGYGLPAK